MFTFGKVRWNGKKFLLLSLVFLFIIAMVSADFGFSDSTKPNLVLPSSSSGCTCNINSSMFINGTLITPNLVYAKTSNTIESIPNASYVGLGEIRMTGISYISSVLGNYRSEIKEGTLTLENRLGSGDTWSIFSDVDGKLKANSDVEKTNYTFCFSDGTNCLVGKNMNYTNVAMTNQSNTFTRNQTIRGNIEINDTQGAVVIGSTSGNNRGKWALDLQTYRSSDVEVCSGLASTCLGNNNKATEQQGLGIGASNYVLGQLSFGIGAVNELGYSYANTVIGYDNDCDKTRGGGYNNIIGYNNRIDSGCDDGGLCPNGDVGYSGAIGLWNTVDAGVCWAIGVNNKCTKENTMILGLETSDILGADGWQNYAICYLTTGNVGQELGHCTSIVGIGGSCTCVAN